MGFHMNFQIWFLGSLLVHNIQTQKSIHMQTQESKY
jgi:hypothetical protein